MFAYVCGFDGNRRLRKYFEKEWQHEVTVLIEQGVNCVIRWALVANKIIDRIKANHKFRDEQDLRLVMLFDPNDYVK